jgi:hypothetical protein
MSRIVLTTLLVATAACSELPLDARPEAPSPADASQTLSAAASTAEVVWGPRTFARGRGQPERELTTISIRYPELYEAEAVLHVRRLGRNARLPAAATITLNGSLVLGPSDFTGQASELRVPFPLTSEIELGVELRSAPQSQIEVWIEARPRGAAGLQAAICTLAEDVLMQYLAYPLLAGGSFVRGGDSYWYFTIENVHRVVATRFDPSVVIFRAEVDALVEYYYWTDDEDIWDKHRMPLVVEGMWAIYEHYPGGELDTDPVAFMDWLYVALHTNSAAHQLYVDMELAGTLPVQVDTPEVPASCGITWPLQP